MTRKIAIIGGGSMYTAGLLESVVGHAAEGLAGCNVYLMDTDPNALKQIRRYGEYLINVSGVNVAIDASTDLHKALDGADFVLTTFRVGGFDTLAQDEEIPLQYEMIGNETTGVGGTFMALRTVPVVLEVCRDMEALCPNAWLINYTNPTNFIADAVRRETHIQCISLCDNYIITMPELSFLLGVDQKEIYMQTAGVNHLTWVLTLRVSGQPGYPQLIKRVQEIDIEALCSPDPNFYQQHSMKYYPDHYYIPWAVKLFNIYGYYPCGASYHKYYYLHDETVQEMKKPTYNSLHRHFRRQAEWFFEKLERAIASNEPPTPDTSLGYHGHGDLAINVIAAIINNRREEFVVNIPNHGAISNLPYEAIVEVPALIDSDGAHAFSLGDYPKSLIGQIYSQILHEELVVDAALSGNKKQALIGLLGSPLIHSTRRAKDALEMMFELQVDLLPQFS